MKLPELTDVFEKACQNPAGSGAMRLFETGTFAFSGKPTFYIPLVRQRPGGEAYVRLHLEIRYPPDERNGAFSGAVWDEEPGGGFSACVRAPDAYPAVREEPPAAVGVFLDET